MTRLFTLLAVLASLAFPMSAANLVNPYRFGVVYVPNTADFDGTNDHIQLTSSGPTGFADGKVISFFCWVNPSAGDGATRRIVDFRTSGNSVRFQVNLSSVNRIQVAAANSAGTLILNIVATSNTITAASGWVAVYGCFDLTDTAKRKIYFGTTSQTLNVIAWADDTMDLVSASAVYTVGANSAGTEDFTGAISDLWIDDAYIDNPAAFLNGTNPRSLGADGSLPTGSQPAFYFPGNGDAFATNAGTGGGFTLTGTLGTVTPPP